MKISYFFYLIKIVVIAEIGYSQNIPTSQIVKSVQLDSVMVIAARSGFNVEDFVDMVKNDTTFYQAFRNLKTHEHRSDNGIFIFSKNNKIKASLQNTTRQYILDNCRWMETSNEKVTGNFYDRKRAFNYYTPEMYAVLFWIKDTVCDVYQNRSGRHLPSKQKLSFSMETHIDQLKTFMFNPGSEIEGVPLVGKKLAIFDEKMARYYDYFIYSDKYLDSIPCYVFAVKSKTDLNVFQEGRVVVDSLVTYFSKKDFGIVARKYHLSYSSILFDFNIMFDIRLQKLNGEIIPKRIYYEGFWDIPFKKPEIAKFEVDFYQ